MIYTFYSFKGGVGRSMALANVAEILYRRGLRVLMVDFDLEAPGLERYFDVPEAKYSADEVLSKRGLIDLLLSYKDLRLLLSPDTERARTAGAVASSVLQKNNDPSLVLKDTDGDTIARKFTFPVEPLSNFVVPIYGTSSNGGELSMIPAGSRAKELYKSEEGAKDEFARYAERVRSFAWDDFYINWEGENFFDWFVAAANDIADVVLVDSRTGVTEMSGVCTYHLADMVVMFVTPNFQNLNGTLMIANSLTNKKLISEGRKGRPLSLLIVPSRVESGEGEKLDQFGLDFEATFKNIMPPTLKFKDGAFIALKVPYVPYYAYVEDVASRGPAAKQPKAADLIRAFEKLTETLSQLSPPQSELFKSYHAESDDPRDRTAEEAFARLSVDEQEMAEFVLTRLVQVGSVKDGSHDTLLRAALGSFVQSEQKLLRTLADHQLVVIEKELSDGEDIVRIADEALLRQWKKLRAWLKERRYFWLWRQQLKSNIEQWELNERDKASLLSGKMLADAKIWQKKYEKRLNDTENYYISLSARKTSQKFWSNVIALSAVVGLIVTLLLAWFQTTKQQRLEREKALALAMTNKESGDQSTRNGDLKAAVEFYGSAIDLNPNYLDAINGRGKAYLSLAQYDAAINDFNRVIELNPESAEPFVNRGIAYLLKNDPDHAIADFNRAIELDPRSALSYFNRGNAFSAKQQYDEAVADYDQALALNRDYLEAYYNRALTYKSKFDKDKTLSEFKDKAVSDLIHVKVATTVPGMRLDADRLLQELMGDVPTTTNQTPEPATPQVYLHYNDPKDLEIINVIVDSIKRNGISIVAKQTEGTTAGDIRYYYIEDKPNAAKVRQLVNKSLAALNKDVRLIFLGNYYKNVERGNIEVWLPALSSGPEAMPALTPLPSNTTSPQINGVNPG